MCVLLMPHSSDVSVFGKEKLFVPRSTRQYLYKIKPLVPVQAVGKVNKSTRQCVHRACCLIIIIITHQSETVHVCAIADEV